MSAATNPATAHTMDRLERDRAERDRMERNRAEHNRDNRPTADVIDPSMEEILASIRRIIADDQALPLTQRRRERPAQPVVEESVHVSEPAPAQRPVAVSRADVPDSDFEAWLSETAKRAREDQADPGTPAKTEAARPASVQPSDSGHPEPRAQQSEPVVEPTPQKQVVRNQAVQDQVAPELEARGKVAPEQVPHEELLQEQAEAIPPAAPTQNAAARDILRGVADQAKSPVGEVEPPPQEIVDQDDQWDLPEELQREALAGSGDAGERLVDEGFEELGAAAREDGHDMDRPEAAGEGEASDLPEDGEADELDTPVFAGTEGARLLSGDTTSSISSSFQALTQTVMMQNSAIIEQEIRGLLKPMLKQWLDDNLPTMVERLVRAEIERVARGAP